MNEEPPRGYLILADITGYTSYLAGVELTHAQDVLAELLELIVERFKPLLNVVKLEGDAVFAHLPHTQILRAESLLELLEATYLEFRDRVETIRRNTTCQCNACRSIPNLDLKFFVHFGAYLVQRVSGITELVGSDVNLIHHLLKNHVREETGWKAYLLFTDAGLTQMGLELDDLHVQTESYEHLGDIKVFCLNLHDRYETLIAARRSVVKPVEADVILTRNIPAPPVVVWDWMNDVQKRLEWENYDDIRPLLRPDGRTGPGARNHCAHGNNLVLEKILDWRPFEYYTTEYPLAIQTRYLEPVPSGTRLNLHAKLKIGLPSWLKRPLARLMFKMTKTNQQFDKMVQIIAEKHTE